ncbi:MAG TPA: Gfo/Idh/MocA family oxidoreductase [Nocardioidaceae bacterium]|nr:Gfo/Idh/MocA family oxidoreductase [Nocardioidaceae bacterium]
MGEPSLRWALLGTANIAAKGFLPAARAAGHDAVVVGSRDPARARAWAADNGVTRSGSYREALTAGDVDAVYVAVPNEQHIELAARAVEAEKVVLCEKPVALDAAGARELVDAAGHALLWEAFVFPFHPQTALLQELIGPGGPIGRLREIISEFHFRVSSTANIRWDPGHGGGALLDVGCYPIRLARLLFGSEPKAAVASEVRSKSGVDAEFAAVLEFPGDRRLLFSAGMQRSPSTFTRLIGDEGELRVSNPFHPTAADIVELWQAGRAVRSWPNQDTTAFQHAVSHIARAVAGLDTPRHLVADDSVGNAAALDLARAAVTW